MGIIKSILMCCTRNTEIENINNTRKINAMATNYIWVNNNVIWDANASIIYIASFPAHLAFNLIYKILPYKWARTVDTYNRPTSI